MKRRLAFPCSATLDPNNVCAFTLISLRKICRHRGHTRIRSLYLSESDSKPPNKTNISILAIIQDDMDADVG